MKKKGLWTVLALALVVCVTSVVCAAEDKEENKKADDKPSPYLVKLRIFVKKDPEEKEGRSYASMTNWRSSYLKRYIDGKQSLNGSAVVISPEGALVTGDIAILERMIEKIEAQTMDGTRFEVKKTALLIHGPGLILEPVKPLEKKLDAPTFAEVAEMPEDALVAALGQSGGEWFMRNMPLQKYFVQDEKGTLVEYYGAGSSGGNSMSEMVWWADMRNMMTSAPSAGLITDNEGTTLGLTLGARLDPTGEESPWRGGDVLADGNRVSVKAYEELQERIKKELGPSLCHVKIEFRKDKKAGRGRGMDYRAMMSMGRNLFDAKGKLQDYEVYGIALTPKRLFVPFQMTRALAGKIENVVITDGEKKLEGEFAGAFKDLGGFIVQPKEDDLSNPAVLQPHALPARGTFFVGVTVSKKFGGKHWEFTPERQGGKERGYKNKLNPTLVTPVSVGTFLVDLEGQLVGMFSQELTGKEEEKSFDRSSRYSSFGGRNLNRVYSLAELVPVLSAPEGHFNPNIKHLLEEDEQMLPWLGVECSKVDVDLAKAMEIEKATKDGTVGLLVSHVYKNSPAETIGIEPQDVLISVTKKDDTAPIELSPSGSGFDFDWDFGEYGPEREYDVRSQRMKKSWKSRKNYLTMLLQAIGVGKKVTLSYLHDGTIKNTELEVVMAPRDFNSATKHKDEDLGMTIKQLTYEVRKALNLEENAPGVVIAKVEPGESAGVAKLSTYELITKVAGKDVTSVDNFKEHIKNAQDAGKESVVITIFAMGKSRIADLDVQAKKD